ncbi:SGNH/GDSL hydrolase family protein [Kribbia dieselivorans]|uniref:SGNH/GDSL hydrolase family protein n=1 Tax=Kribbia dieselivorans TaxID=331526 RepID=UPI00083914FE|nr:SGNH/GDSL hydrolase family protein [Kribbia dieselivorans]
MNRHADTPVWSRYVAIGDSFTEGMCDDRPGAPDEYLGWADRLAEHLDRHAREHGAEFAYANHAVRGRLLADVLDRQLDLALAQQPDLVSMVGGGNDLLRPRVDVDAIGARIEQAVITIRATGADVLLATPTDTANAGLLTGLRGRHAVHTANLLSIARRHGAYVINQWSFAFLRDWRMWAQDRIHMTPEGHRRIALAAAQELGVRTGDTDWATPLERGPKAPLTQTLREDAVWLKEFAGPWVQRRVTGRSSGDGRVGKRPELRPLP